MPIFFQLFLHVTEFCYNFALAIGEHRLTQSINQSINHNLNISTIMTNVHNSAIVAILSVSSTRSAKIRALAALGLTNTEISDRLGYSNMGAIWNVVNAWREAGCPNPFAALNIDTPEGVNVGDAAAVATAPRRRSTRTTGSAAVVGGDRLVTAVTRAADQTTASVEALNIATAALRSVLETEASMRTAAPIDIYAGHTIGIELEMGVESVSNTRERFTRRGIRSVQEGYCHTNETGATWHFKYDSSVRTSLENTELVSPILRGADGVKVLNKVLYLLEDMRTDCNRTTGFHVHVGCTDLEVLKNAVINYTRCQAAINKFLAPSRRGGNTYCELIPVNRIASIATADSIRDLQNAANRLNRYHVVNLMSQSSHGTIEFRQHQGTTNYKKVSAWVEFIIRLMNYSKTERLVGNIDSIADIPWMTPELIEYYTFRAECLG